MGEGKEEQSINAMYEQLTGVSTRKWFPLAKELGLDSLSRQLRDPKLQAGDSRWESLKTIWRETKVYLEKKAETQPNSPFIQIGGVGYVEVPASVVAPLTMPGFNLGTVLASPGILKPGHEAFRYIEETFGFEKVDRQNIRWAGSAKEALGRLKTSNPKRSKD